MMLRINGSDETIAAATVAELLDQRGIEPTAKFLAVAVNGAIVPRTEWQRHALTAGDEIEIVRPFSGG